MNMLPDLTVDPSTWHPSWCSADFCSAPDRLAERGLTEADVPLHRRHVHQSAPVTIGSVEREDSIITLQAERFTDQPPAEPGVDAVALTIEHPLHGTRVVALLEPDLLDQLAHALTDMRALVHGHLIEAAEVASTMVNSGLPAPANEAVRALRGLGAVSRSDAMRLLQLWPGVETLDGSQQEAVWESFPVVVEDGDR